MLGFINVYKPSGITSNAVISRIKRRVKPNKIGHMGTLDPMATGVLPIFIGRATVLSQYLIDADKSYSATVKLGITTDSCDITGDVISEVAVENNDQQIEEVLKRFIGKQLQTPPMYSAIKQNGVRMYELARRGESVDIPAREITVFSIDKTSHLNGENEFDIDCTVSKGTYIRSLCRDIGDALGCGATLTRLCRTSTAGFGIEKCVNLDDLTPDNISDYVMPCDIAVNYMPKIFVSKKQAIRFGNGGQLSLDRIKYTDFIDDTVYRVYFDERFLGLGLADTNENLLRIECLVDR